MRREYKKYIRPTVFYIMLFLFLLAMHSTSIGYDYDLWARLIVGKHVFQTGQVLKQDFLSYTPTHNWFDHEWGSSFIFYLFQHYFSYVGLLFLQVILIFLMFFLITKIIKLRGVKTTTPYNIVFYFFFFSAILYFVDEIIRCQVFSFLFFTIFLYILELARKDINKPLFALPFLMIIWNNLHGGCVAGIGLIAIYIVGELINKKPIKKFIISLFFTILVLPLNPWGFYYLPFLLKATTMPRPDIVEFWNLFDYRNKGWFLEFKYFALVLILMQSLFIIRSIKEKTFSFDATKYLAIIVTLVLAIQHIKMIPFSIITLTVFFYDDFYTTFNRLTLNAINKAALFKDIIIYLLILICVFKTVGKRTFEPFLNTSRFPVVPVEFIRENNIKGNLVVPYGWGSYASYKLYPKNKIFMDGRYEEVYDDSMITILETFMHMGNDWNVLLKKYPPDIILIPNDYAIYDYLKTNPEWKQIFNKNFFVIFVKKSMAKEKYKMPSDSTEYYKKTIFDTDIDFKGESWQKK